MLPLLEALAVVSSACFGVLLARSKKMDLVGCCALGSIVAFGGGTLRDLLLDRAPLFWIANEHYAWIVLGLASVGAFVPVPQRLTRWLHFPDALGLGFFSVVGAALALEQGVSPLIAVLCGVITGTFGGVIGDIVSNEVPALFRPGVALYASCSFVGCWVSLGALQLQLGDAAAQWSAVATIVVLRMAALRWNWSLPAPAS